LLESVVGDVVNKLLFSGIVDSSQALERGESYTSGEPSEVSTRAHFGVRGEVPGRANRFQRT